MGDGVGDEVLCVGHENTSRQNKTGKTAHLVSLLRRQLHLSTAAFSFSFCPNPCLKVTPAPSMGRRRQVLKLSRNQPASVNSVVKNKPR